jgi:hypothetical protein
LLIWYNITALKNTCYIMDKPIGKLMKSLFILF